MLLRIANVNPDSVTTHSDRVLYRAIGAFILLYFLYATAGGAAFVDASANYSHPWWQWLVGPAVAAGVIAYDRAVVGRVAVNFELLGSPDPHHLLRRPTLGLYVGRAALAVLFAALITEPLMLARYSGEIDARLNQVHNQQLAAADAGGAVGAFQARLARLTAADTADDQAVAALHAQAAENRSDARTLYRQALADSAGRGVTRRAGCPSGGSCDALVTRSRGLDDQAVALDAQAGRLQQSQQSGRTARAAEADGLARAISAQRNANATAIAADAGFGARTSAMWYLVSSDFWGIGIFYIGIALLLMALDCAAVGLKFVSHGNAYERTEARAARRQEYEAVQAYERGLRDARTLNDAGARVLAEAFDQATHDDQLVRAAAERARAQLRAAVTGRSAVDAARAIAADDVRAARTPMREVRLTDLQAEDDARRKVRATQG